MDLAALSLYILTSSKIFSHSALLPSQQVNNIHSPTVKSSSPKLLEGLSLHAAMVLVRIPGNANIDKYQQYIALETNINHNDLIGFHTFIAFLTVMF